AVGVLAAVLVVACQAAPAAPTAVPKAAPAGPTAPAAAAQNATVTMLGSTFGNESVDPFNTTSNNSNFMHFFATPLIEGDGKGGMAPGVFTNWESNADASTWTFTIRPGVKAHNGNEITLDDVWWNLDSRFGDMGKERVKAGEKVFAPIVSLAALTKK